MPGAERTASAACRARPDSLISSSDDMDVDELSAGAGTFHGDGDVVPWYSFPDMQDMPAHDMILAATVNNNERPGPSAAIAVAQHAARCERRQEELTHVVQFARHLYHANEGERIRDTEADADAVVQ